MKRKRRATLLEAMVFLQKELTIESLGTRAVRIILKEVLPFSWMLYCKEHKLNQDILMDNHEKRLRKGLCE